jgi:hypothetical protein
MGKTLSILALIIGTLDVAHKWATSSSIDCVIREPNAVQFPKRTGATLVVASADRTCSTSSARLSADIDYSHDKRVDAGNRSVRIPSRPYFMRYTYQSSGILTNKPESRSQ